MIDIMRKNMEGITKMDSKRLFVITLLFLTGCASNLPVELTTPIEGSPQVSEVLQNIDAHNGELVRWGGSIASIDNKENETWVEIVSRELNRSGRPKRSDQTSGRFLAKVNDFLDPEIYKNGRLVTIYGELAGGQDGKIGEQSYTFPVVNSKKAYMWSEYRDPLSAPYYRRPYYDPFYDPYWDLHYRHRYFYGHPHYWY